MRVSIYDLIVVVIIIAESTVVVVIIVVDMLNDAGMRLSHSCFRPLKIVPVEAKTTKVMKLACL